MSAIDEVRKLKASDFALIIGIAFSVVIPGVLTVYLHEPALFSELEMTKLLLLASVFTMPVVLINFVALYWTEDKEDTQGKLLIDSMALACLVLLPALLVSYLFSLSYKWHIGVVLVFQLVVFYLVKIMRKHEANKP